MVQHGCNDGNDGNDSNYGNDASPPPRSTFISFIIYLIQQKSNRPNEIHKPIAARVRQTHLIFALAENSFSVTKQFFLSLQNLFSTTLDQKKFQQCKIQLMQLQIHSQPPFEALLLTSEASEKI